MLPDQFLPALIAEVLSLARALAKVQRASGLLPGSRALLETLQTDGAQTVSQTARKKGTSRQNIQILVNRLAKQGAIVLANNPDHQKSWLVNITERGQRLLASAQEQDNRLLTRVDLACGSTEVRSATDLLGHIRKQLQPGAHGCRAARSPRSKPSKVASQPPPAKPGRMELTASAPEHPPEEVSEELPVNLL